MKPERGRHTERGKRTCGERQLPTDQERDACAEFERDDQRKQRARNVVRCHVIEKGLRAGDFRQASENELNRKHRRALGALVTRLFELFGKKAPADPVEIATGFIALGRGMALLSKGGEASRSGRIIVTFLKALIESSPAATDASNP